MKSVAVIGSGIAGMGAAYALHRAGWDVTVYEQNDYIGGHTRTRTIDYDGTSIAVDTGFIVFNYRNYPELSQLFHHLAVDVHKSDMSFGVSVDNGRLEWGARNLRAVFGQWSNLFSPKFYGMIVDVRRFFKAAPALLDTNSDLTLGEYLDQLGVSDDFRRYFLLPMGGAIWSCPLEVMMRFPARTFIHFFHNHGLLSFSDQPQWYTVTGGAHSYVRKITASFKDKIKTGCGAASITRTADGIIVQDTQGNTNKHQHVVLACHPDQALRLLSDPTAAEAGVLGSFTYQKNTVYLHRDTSQMPKRRACWSSWVYLANQSDKGDRLAVTYWMNQLQGIDHNKPLFVTLNPIQPIDPALIFDRVELEHPVFNASAVAAQDKVAALQGQQNTWFCGAWQRYGFHEDGLQSAVRVLQGMGVPIPWH